MEKNKGLADTHEGEFTLNESGTSVSIDPVEGVDVPEIDGEKENDKNKESTPKDQKQDNKV